MSQGKDKKVNSQTELSQKAKDLRIIELYLLLNPEFDRSLLRVWRLNGAKIDQNDIFDTMRLLIVGLLHDIEATVRENGVLRRQIHNLKSD